MKNSDWLHTEMAYPPTDGHPALICTNVVLQLDYFNDPLVFCLHNLNSINYKDSALKTEFLERFLKYIPRLPTVSKSASS